MKKATAILLFVVYGSASTGEEEGPVTWEEFHRGFQFGLHCTLHTQPSRVTWNPTMHYTGPDTAKPGHPYGQAEECIQMQ